MRSTNRMVHFATSISIFKSGLSGLTEWPPTTGLTTTVPQKDSQMTWIKFD